MEDKAVRADTCDEHVALYEQAPVGYLVLNATRRIGRVNLCAIDLLGAAGRHELLERCFDDFVVEKDVDRWRQWFAGLDPDLLTASIELELQRPGAAEFHARLACHALPDQNGGRVAYLAISDFTERRETDLVLAQHKARLEETMAARTADLLAREARISRISCLTAALAAINKSILHDAGRHEVFLAACRALVDEGGYKLAWMGQPDAAGERIEVRQSFGQAGGFLDDLIVDVRPDRPEGNVPTAIAFRRQSVYLSPELNADPAAVAWLEKAAFYGFESAIALPVVCDGRAWGVLTACGEKKQMFDKTSRTVLEEIARALSFAIRHCTSEAQENVLAVQEAARRQLADELHDRTSPNLAAIEINFGLLARSLPKEQFANLSERLEDIQALIKDTAASIRDICADLRPPVLDHAGLGAALEAYARQFARRTGINVYVHCTNQARRLAPDVESLLFRIAQESLSNCTRHSHAGRVDIRLDNEASPVVLCIADDGEGFVPDRIGKAGHIGGLGVLNMRKMAEFAGGKFTIDSAPGDGTRIRVEIP